MKICKLVFILILTTAATVSFAADHIQLDSDRAKFGYTSKLPGFL